MEAVLLRGGSISASPATARFQCSSAISLSRHDSLAGVFSYSEKSAPCSSPKLSVKSGSTIRRRESSSPGTMTMVMIRRARSDADLLSSFSGLSTAGSMMFPALMQENECNYLSEVDRRNHAGIALEKEFAGFGVGGGTDYGGCGGADGGNGGYGGGYGGDRSKMRIYYEEMLKLNAGDFLLLRNYAKYLHEVERDEERAAEYYGRAILASPGDGEVLSLYARLIWETQRDEDRARCYFNRAVQASPDNCVVTGAYAQFIWEATREEEDDEKEENEEELFVLPAMAAAF